ncbi:MAG TPA: DUF4261 domain-containing protein [Bacteroidia bacterium]|nr:DUF4261 domain-containing protein [Bacteroidia bacterium]
MGLFSNLFGKKKITVALDSPSVPSPGAEINLSVFLLFSKAPSFDQKALDQGMETQFGPAMTSSMVAATSEGVFGHLQFGQDEMMLAQLDVPIPPQVLKPILAVCHFGQDDKLLFHINKCHFLLTYKGNGVAPTVAMDRIYNAIGVLVGLEGSAIGVVNENAMTAHRTTQLQNIQSERSKSTTSAMPMMTWMAWTGGFVKYLLDDKHIWFVTKGNHQFGLPELAYLGAPTDMIAVMDLFFPLFNYMYFYQAKLAPGHTIDLGQQKLRISALKEHRDMLEGKFGTLVVNKI